MHHLSELDAPTDVDAAIEWMIAAGFAVSRLLTSGQPNGNKLIELVRGDEVWVIVRDRGQWECNGRGEGWVAGLALLHEASTGVVFGPRPGAPLPQQHPSDELRWVEAIPAVFAWRENTADWRDRLAAAHEAAAERIRRRQV